MKGKHTIVVRNRRVQFTLELERNITVIRGDSATGKTTLIGMLRDYEAQGSQSGVVVEADKPCRVLTTVDWEERLHAIENAIVFIDEGNAFVNSQAFASAIMGTSNYYVLITRESLYQLPYSVEAVLEIKETTRQGKFTCNQTYPYYKNLPNREEKLARADCILTEDSNAGHQMFAHIAESYEEVLNTIVSYKLPVITLDKSTPREAVCKVFENVNTGGVPLTVFELVTATFATYSDPATNEGFDLRKDWEKNKRIIQGLDDTLRTDLLDGIDETTFLTTVALYTSYKDKRDGKIGAVSCKKKDVLALDFYSYLQNRDAVLLGFQLAREFLLKYQYVFRMRDLPYTTQLIPLSAICAFLGKSKCNEPNTVRVLTRWYWCGILGEMYGGANETRYANDIEDIVDEVYGKPNPARTINSAFFSATRLLTLQTRLSAAYKGIMALLYKEKCRDFMNNTTIDLVNSMVQAPDIHHIFPEAYCEKVGIKRQRYNSIINKTPLLPETNRAIGGNAPSQYTKTILKKVDGLTEAELKDRIESHMVNYDMLIMDDFDTYFIDRSKKLLLLIEKAMGKPVADRNAETTIEQFGASLI